MLIFDMIKDDTIPLTEILNELDKLETLYVIYEYETLLNLSIQYNNLDIVKALLRRNSDLINFGDYMGRVPLIQAIIYNRREILNYLYTYNIKYNVCDKHGKTALHYAVETNNLHFVKELSNLNIDINSCDMKGNTPLLVAVNNKNASIISYLVNKGANIFFKNNLGVNALKRLCVNKEENNRLIYILLFNELYQSIKDDDYERLSSLLKHVINIRLEYENTTLLLEACKYNCSYKLVEYLINMDSDLNFFYCNRTPLYYAYVNKNDRLVKLLLNNVQNWGLH